MDKISKRYYFIILLIILCINTNAQNKYMPPDPNLNWDGITHWTRYMISSPGYMGPNALPVPELRSGSVGNESRIQLGYAFHYNSMDPTQNVFAKFIIPVYKDKVTLEFSIIPIEIFDMDSVLRWERHTHQLKGEGIAFGDIYFGSNIQLAKDHKSLPDMVLRFMCKTASGNHLAEARYTDSPGYYFDLNFGKKLGNQKPGKIHAKFTGMVGFMAWQTYHINNRQNDAFIFGGGLLLSTRSFEFHNNFSGFIGYMNIGDQPVIFRSDLTIKGPNTDLKLEYKHGLHDFNYQSISASLIFHWETRKKTGVKSKE